LKRKLPNLKYITISAVLPDDVTNLDKENKGLADFIICVDEDMTKTY